MKAGISQHCQMKLRISPSSQVPFHSDMWDMTLTRKNVNTEVLLEEQQSTQG